MSLLIQVARELVERTYKLTLVTIIWPRQCEYAPWTILGGTFLYQLHLWCLDEYPDQYIFQNPDTVTVIDDPTTTLREAYEAINLPFFNVVFQISGNTYKIFINGFWVYTDTILTTYTDETFSLETFELQAVNYGYADGSPKAGYAVTYSNPVVKTI